MKTLFSMLARSVAVSGFALGIGLMAAPVQAAPIITTINADLTQAPFTFTLFGDSFTFGSNADIFNPLTISTSGEAQVSSFGGFLGIPSVPSPFFTNRGTVRFGSDEFGRFDSFTSTTPVGASNGDNFLGLKVTQDGQDYYGFAFTTNAFLNSIGFETLPGTTITATTDVAAAVPEPATWAMLILGFGLIGGAMRKAKGPKVALTYA